MNALITGSYRSGTTLVDKMLHMHPDAAVFSQPFPFLYIDLKRRFLASIGHSDPYPLGSLFRERRYRRDSLADYLAVAELSEEQVRRSATAQEGYSGFWTPELLDHLDALGAGSLTDIQRRMHSLLASHFGRPDATVVGSKEILIEEFIPHFAAHNIKVILMLRDPRAVLASLTFGSGQDYGGRRRPTLFHIRNWRKSVAFALAGFPAHQVMVVRYEDVVRNPTGSLVQVCHFLGLDGQAVDYSDGAIRDQWGNVWAGNSSFDSPGNINRWRELFDDATVDYIEACTLPEMLAVGYQPIRAKDIDQQSLERFREPFVIERKGFAADFSTCRENLNEEAERLRLAQRPSVSPELAEDWFIFPQTHYRLQQAMSA